MVNFARPAIFLGDGQPIDLWDGRTYIGALEAGTLIQYEAAPGKHLFLAKIGNWSYVVADLRADRQYFIRGNMYPFGAWGHSALSVAEPSDPRIAEWLRYQPISVSERDRKEAQVEKGNEVRAAIAQFDSGQVSPSGTVQADAGR